jgi:hypothetical protein
MMVEGERAFGTLDCFSILTRLIAREDLIEKCTISKPVTLQVAWWKCFLSYFVKYWRKSYKNATNESRGSYITYQFVYGCPFSEKLIIDFTFQQCRTDMKQH